MSLYLKYRPTELSQLKGNTELIASLEGLLRDVTTCPHAFLLHGPTGTGKTTIGRIVANRLGCVEDDFTELNTADVRGIDTVRDIIQNTQFMPMQGRCRVWLLDEFHKATPDAQNALLKILEDTPTHVYFIICSTEPQRLIKPLRDRCIQLQTHPLTDTQMFGLLRRVARDESVTVDSKLLELIAAQSLGCPRNAIQTLETVLSVDEQQRMVFLKKTTDEQTQGIELCRALIKGADWATVAKILTGLKEQDPEDVRRLVLGYCQTILLKGEHDLAAHIMEEFLEPTYTNGFNQIIYACYSIIKT